MSDESFLLMQYSGEESRLGEMEGRKQMLFQYSLLTIGGSTHLVLPRNDGWHINLIHLTNKLQLSSHLYVTKVSAKHLLNALSSSWTEQGYSRDTGI